MNYEGLGMRACLTLLFLAACIPAEREGTNISAAGSARDTNLVEARVPRAAAGDSGWKYSQTTSADFDGDGSEERAILTADVAVDSRGRPLWGDGHRWQLYIEEADSARTYAYAAFVPNGNVTVDVVQPSAGSPPTILLMIRTPFSLAAYDIAYHGPGRSVVLNRFERNFGSRPFVEAPHQ